MFPEGLPPLRSRMRHSPHGKKQILLADRSRGWMVDNRFCNKIWPASGDIHLATGQFLIHFCNSQRKRRALPEQLMDRSRDHRRSIAVGHLGFIDPACGTGQRVSGRCSNLDLTVNQKIALQTGFVKTFQDFIKIKSKKDSGSIRIQRMMQPAFSARIRLQHRLPRRPSRRHARVLFGHTAMRAFLLGNRGTGAVSKGKDEELCKTRARS